VNVIKDLAKIPMSLKDYNLMEMQERVGVAPEHVLGRDKEPKYMTEDKYSAYLLDYTQNKLKEPAVKIVFLLR